MIKKQINTNPHYQNSKQLEFESLENWELFEIWKVEFGNLGNI